MAGQYETLVQLEGALVEGTPFITNVAPAALSPAHCTLSEAALEFATSGVPATFQVTVSATPALAFTTSWNATSVTVSASRVYVAYASGGQYQFAYLIDRADTYSVALTEVTSDTPIAGSPFSITVAPLQVPPLCLLLVPPATCPRLCTRVLAACATVPLCPVLGDCALCSVLPCTWCLCLAAVLVLLECPCAVSLGQGSYV